MLILSLNIGEERYGIEAKNIIEIVPFIDLKKIPLSESTIKGMFNYRGSPTLVIDLCQLFENRDCDNNLSTRIILIKYKTASGESRSVGLIAEKVTDMIQVTDEDVSDSGMQNRANDFLGRVYNYNHDIIQLIDTYKVLPDSISQQLPETLY